MRAISSEPFHVGCYCTSVGCKQCISIVKVQKKQPRGQARRGRAGLPGLGSIDRILVTPFNDNG